MEIFIGRVFYKADIWRERFMLYAKQLSYSFNNDRNLLEISARKTDYVRVTGK
jgi:hypothetical protein